MGVVPGSEMSRKVSKNAFEINLTNQWTLTILLKINLFTFCLLVYFLFTLLVHFLFTCLRVVYFLFTSCLLVYFLLDLLITDRLPFTDQSNDLNPINSRRKLIFAILSYFEHLSVLLGPIS